MNIKILDSWLREHVKTTVTPKEFAEMMSLTSVSIERIEKVGKDFLYDIEITTNRPDLMSVVGLAREAATVLPQFGKKATFIPPQLITKPSSPKKPVDLTISYDKELTQRICAVVMEVSVKPSSELVQNRLESTDIRSLNNIIDITNYVMRVIGHPTHVFDYDRLNGTNIHIRESKKGEKIKTLDGKEYKLPGGDIVAENEKGDIIDLLGIMGLQNSVVTNDTKRIVYFINTDDPIHIRKTSMALGIRTEAAQLNEKGVDPELAYDALLYGIELYTKHAEGKIISKLIDIYPQPYKAKSIRVTTDKIQRVIGVPVTLKQSSSILENLGFETTQKGSTLDAKVPSFRAKDVTIPEDLIEEIARMYGYHNIPTELPLLENTLTAQIADEFYWENRVKTLLKHWGFTEVYTYAMVHENLFEGELIDAVKIQNPLNEDMVYMRKTLMPSLLQVIAENKTHENFQLFEIANVYYKKSHSLPDEKPHLAGVIKKPEVSFFEVKGIIEQLAIDLGIKNLTFKPIESGSAGAEVFVDKERLGDIEILDRQTINFELDFTLLLSAATARKTYTPIPKYPSLVEDMAFIVPEDVLVGDIIRTIERQSTLIKTVSLFDKYQQTRTFRVVYQAQERNLKNEDIAPLREKIAHALQEKFGAKLK